MPSGSHGGGGGHSGGFSGGGGSWGGHSGGGSSSSSPIFPRSTRGGRSVVIIGGFGGHGGRYVTSGIFSLLQVMLTFAFLMVFFGIILASSASPSGVQRDYQHDYDYYQNMIAYAETDPNYLLTTGAVITDRFMGKGGNKYYLTYRFYTSGPSHIAVDGYTYTTYTLEDLKKPELQVGQTIVLALNCRNDQITTSTDSIDIQYKNTTLWDDDDFVHDYKTAKTTQTVGIVVIVVGLLLGAGAIALFIIKSKKDDGDESSTTVTTKVSKEYCKYCGTLLKPGSVKCDNCGASLTDTRSVETSSTTISNKNKK